MNSKTPRTALKGARGGESVSAPKKAKHIYKFECGLCHQIIKNTNKLKFMKEVREHLMTHDVYITWRQLRLLALASIR